MAQGVKIVTHGELSCIDEVLNAVQVSIVGGAGSGGTSMTDDAAFSPGSGGVTPAAGVYQSTPDTVNDGDAGALRMTQSRALIASLETPAGDSAMDDTNDAVRVNLVAGGGSGGTSQADRSAFVEGTGVVTPIAGVLNDTISADPTENTVGAVRITAKAGLHSNLRNVAGAETGVLAVPLRVDPVGTTAQPVTDNGSSLTVDGSVTANAGTNLNTSLLALESGGNLASVAGCVGGTELQVDIVAALPAGTNAIGKLAANTGVDIGDVDVTSVVPGTGATSLGKAEDAAHSSGDVGVMALAVRAASPTERSAGPTDGDYEPLAVNEVGAVWVSPTPSAGGGLSIFRSIDLDETEEDIKTSAGVVYWYYIYNNAATTHFVKFYNDTAANVVVGTATPAMTIPVPAGAAANCAIEGGLRFGTAICAAATTGVADADTGAPAANAIVINIGYK